MSQHHRYLVAFWFPTPPGTWPHLWFPRVHESQPWCYLTCSCARLTLYDLCILYCHHICSLYHMEIDSGVIIPSSWCVVAVALSISCRPRYNFMSFFNPYFCCVPDILGGWDTNRIYHHIVEGTRESHPSVHDLQSTTRLAESWMLQIMDTRMGFPCPFHNVVIDYFSPTPFIVINNPISTSWPWHRFLQQRHAIGNVVTS